MPTKKSPVKKFYRSTSNRVIAGVCGGLSDYLSVDATLIRLFFLVLTLTSGLGVALYVILAVLTPADNKPRATGRDNWRDLVAGCRAAGGCHHCHRARPQHHGRWLLGLLLCLIGLIALTKNFVPTAFGWFNFDLIFWLVITIIGLKLIISSRHKYD